METQKKRKRLYWLAKGFLVFFMLFSAYYTWSQPEGIKMLGFPDYFRIELVTAKVIGAIALLIPQVSLRVREWVYAGFCISMLSGLIAHICTGDPLSKIIFVSVDFILVAASIQYLHNQDRHAIKHAL